MQIWRLVHIKKRYEIHGLSTEEAVGFLASLPEMERMSWFAWKPGAPQWLKADEHPELTVSSAVTPWWFAEHAIPQVPLPPTVPDFVAPPIAPASAGELPQPEEEAPSSILNLFAPKDGRKEPRTDLRLKVVVTDGANSFRSYSVNVSLGGLLLEKKVPWSMCGKPCQVFLSNETSSEAIEFSARVLSTASAPFRLAFEGGETKYLVVLQKWMEAAQSAVDMKAS